jgi:predicted RNase H-like HicB family nuclease
MSDELESGYTAIIQRDGARWIGWVEEIPGVNSQGQTREELIANLLSALEEAVGMNRADARAATSGDYEEVPLRARNVAPISRHAGQSAPGRRAPAPSEFP